MSEVTGQGSQQPQGEQQTGQTPAEKEAADKARAEAEKARRSR